MRTPTLPKASRRSLLVVLGLALVVTSAPATAAYEHSTDSTALNSAESTGFASESTANPTNQSEGHEQSTAGSTSVTLSPTEPSVNEGSTTTLEVVVTDTKDGIGAIEGTISVVDTEHASIAGFSWNSDPAVENVTIATDGETVSFRGALMDTEQSGEVVVAEVTVTGENEGTTDLSLQVDALGDETGAGYDVGATVDARLSVGNTKDAVPLHVSSNVEKASVGNRVTFTVERGDSNARVRSTVAVGDQQLDTGVDGRITVTLTEAMVADGNTVTATAAKEARREETFINDTVTIDIGSDDNGEGTDGDSGNGTGTDGDDTENTAGTATVGFSSSTVTLQPSQTKTVAVVASNVDTDVGAAEFTVSVEGDDSIRIVEATPSGDPGVEDIQIGDDNSSVDARLALLEAPDEAPVQLLVITIESDEPASGSLSVSVSALGSASGGSYSVGATPDASVSVSESASTTTPVSTESSTPEDTTIKTAEQPATATKTAESLSRSLPGFTPWSALLALASLYAIRYRHTQN